MTPFRERNQTVIGAIGIAAILTVLAASFNIDRIIGGEEYKAEFSEAAGLAPNDEVRIAGVKVGKVLAVDLAGDRVQVQFRVNDAEMGNRTRADIRIKTVLGRKFLSLSPDGDGTLEEGSVIPLGRTSSPYDITQAFGDLSTTVQEIDDEQLAESFRVLADTFRDTPEEVRASLEGLSRLSRAIAARDQQLGALLERTRGVSQVLAERDQDLTAFLADSSLVLQEVQRRREAISRLLETTTQLSEQLIALVRENRAELAPALERLRGVVEVLRKNQDNLDRSIERLAPFVRIFSDNLGNGRWFDTFVQNLLPPGGEFVPGEFGKDGSSRPAGGPR
ncbi:MAG: MCE family protein [Actinobacteria bacterium]|nr:MCE family protein [Actinomycetota bacterium]MBW3647213.1 MCE family protein [Actinomycetota bacterium]